MKNTENSKAGRSPEARKLRVEDPIFWKHHRGGWKYVVGLISEAFHTPQGVKFVSAIENKLFPQGKDYRGTIEEPWVGFLHQLPFHTLNFPDLERLLKLDSWK